MATSDAAFAGSIPELYDRLLVPMIFESYAQDLAGRIAGTRPRDVLETAAGSGVVTRALAAALPKDARIVASDLNQPMLDRAALRQADDPRIAWRQADALALPFPDGAFDTVACQFGVMFFPDRVQGYREARRVLKPDGHFFFSVWDRLSENEFSHVTEETLALRFPDDPPRFLSRTPYGYYDADRIRAELAAAGFTKISIDRVSSTSRSASPREVAVALCQGTPLRNEIEARDASGLEGATKAASDALARQFGDGSIEGRIKACILTAVR